LFDETAGKMDVQGWITLTNNSGTEYRAANTLLVAGAVGRRQEPNMAGGGLIIRRPRRRAAGRALPGTETSNRERIGDFYIYPLAERTTIANRQTKQVSFLDASGAPAQRAYEYRNRGCRAMRSRRTSTRCCASPARATRASATRFPPAPIRVYQRDQRGNPQFVGENRIDHTPMGSDIGLTTGQAFDVKVQPVVVDRRRITAQEWEASYRYRIIENGRPVQEVEVQRQPTSGRRRCATPSPMPARRRSPCS
jgi:hypothetical protein